MIIFLAVSFCVLLGLLAVLQLALAGGAPLGRFAWGGQNDVLPARNRVGSVVSVLLYAVFALIALNRAGAASILPAQVGVIAMWIVAGLLVLSILPNLITRSKPEKRLMVPVSIVLAALAVLIAVG